MEVQRGRLVNKRVSFAVATTIADYRLMLMGAGWWSDEVPGWRVNAEHANTYILTCSQARGRSIVSCMTCLGE